MPVTFEYDESKHPRDGGGRWTAAQSAFITELQHQTYDNPINPAERVTRAQNAVVDVRLSDKGAHIYAIRSFEPGKKTGAGRDALKLITNLADKHGIPLSLTAQKYGKAGLATRTLVGWYGRNGFSGKGGEMTRQPPKNKMAREQILAKIAANFAVWDEALHPREETGRFAPKEGGAQDPAARVAKAREYQGRVAKLDEQLRSMVGADLMPPYYTPGKADALAAYIKVWDQRAALLAEARAAGFKPEVAGMPPMQPIPANWKGAPLEGKQPPVEDTAAARGSTANLIDELQGKQAAQAGLDVRRSQDPVDAAGYRGADPHSIADPLTHTPSPEPSSRTPTPTSSNPDEDSQGSSEVPEISSSMQPLYEHGKAVTDTTWRNSTMREIETGDSGTIATVMKNPEPDSWPSSVSKVDEYRYWLDYAHGNAYVWPAEQQIHSPVVEALGVSGGLWETRDILGLNNDAYVRFYKAQANSDDPKFLGQLYKNIATRAQNAVNQGIVDSAKADPLIKWANTQQNTLDAEAVPKFKPFKPREDYARAQEAWERANAVLAEFRDVSGEARDRQGQWTASDAKAADSASSAAIEASLKAHESAQWSGKHSQATAVAHRNAMALHRVAAALTRDAQRRTKGSTNVASKGLNEHDNWKMLSRYHQQQADFHHHEAKKLGFAYREDELRDWNGRWTDSGSSKPVPPLATQLPSIDLPRRTGLQRAGIRELSLNGQRYPILVTPASLADVARFNSLAMELDNSGNRFAEKGQYRVFAGKNVEVAVPAEAGVHSTILKALMKEGFKGAWALTDMGVSDTKQLLREMQEGNGRFKITNRQYLTRIKQALERVGIEFAFNPDEPRDDHGQWTNGDASSAVPATVKPEHLARLEPRQRDLFLQQYRTAMSEKPAFDKSVEKIAKEVGGSPMLAPLKGSDRATQKIVADYQGDATRISDLLRATVVTPNPDAMAKAADLIRREWDVVKETNRAANPGPDGYRDVLFKVKTGGITSEVQVNLPAMLKAKEEVHGLYVQRESLTRAASVENRPLTAAEAATRDSLNGQMRAVYDRAWEASKRRSQLFASTDDPLRSSEENGKRRGGSESYARQSSPPSSVGTSATGTPSTSQSREPAGSSDARIGDYNTTDEDSLKPPVLSLFSYNPDEPRDDHGEWTSGGDSGTAAKADHPVHTNEQLLQQIKDTGGFTYHPLTHDAPKPGDDVYSVSAFPQREMILNTKDLTPAKLQEYVLANADAFKDPHNYFGAWHDTETGKVFLDTVVLVGDKAAAIKVGQEHNQIAAFSFKDMNTVDIKPERRAEIKNARQTREALLDERRRSAERSQYSSALRADLWPQGDPRRDRADAIRAREAATRAQEVIDAFDKSRRKA